MSDLFRCDYCGQYRPLDDARVYHVHDYTNGDGDDVYTVAVGCGEYCARSLASARTRVGGR